MKIMLSLTKFGIFAMVACLLFPASSVYGHGLGVDTISSIDIQGKEISITVEMPMYFENDQEQSQLLQLKRKQEKMQKMSHF